MPDGVHSMTFFVDVGLNDPMKIINQGNRPILELGKPGTFDEDGIMPICYWRENALFMQYGGWSLRNSVPYSNWLGLAVSYDKESFSKVFENPILDRAENELYSATCSWMIEDEKDGYIMFYAKGNPWVEVNGKLECTYNIVRDTTSDGIKFRRDSSHIINTVLDDEVNTNLQ